MELSLNQIPLNDESTVAGLKINLGFEVQGLGGGGAGTPVPFHNPIVHTLQYINE